MGNLTTIMTNISGMEPQHHWLESTCGDERSSLSTYLRCPRRNTTHSTRALDWKSKLYANYAKALHCLQSGLRLLGIPPLNEVEINQVAPKYSALFYRCNSDSHSVLTCSAPWENQSQQSSAHIVCLMCASIAS